MPHIWNIDDILRKPKRSFRSMQTSFHDEISNSVSSHASTLHDTCLVFLILSNVVFVQALQQCLVDINYWKSANRLKLNMDKTKLLWAGTRRSTGDDSFPSLQLGAAIIAPSQHVRVLGVIFSADLSLRKHVSNVSATCFHHLRRLRHIQRSLTSESATTLCTPS